MNLNLVIRLLYTTMARFEPLSQGREEWIAWLLRHTLKGWVGSHCLRIWINLKEVNQKLGIHGPWGRRTVGGGSEPTIHYSIFSAVWNIFSTVIDLVHTELIGAIGFTLRLPRATKITLQDWRIFCWEGAHLCLTPGFNTTRGSKLPLHCFWGWSFLSFRRSNSHYYRIGGVYYHSAMGWQSIGKGLLTQTFELRLGFNGWISSI